MSDKFKTLAGWLVVCGCACRSLEKRAFSLRMDASLGYHHLQRTEIRRSRDDLLSYSGARKKLTPVRRQLLSTLTDQNRRQSLPLSETATIDGNRHPRIRNSCSQRTAAIPSARTTTPG
jgi:hypothetical protein